jgi:cation diffusion facilitator family transporter
MHTAALSRWRHEHHYPSGGEAGAERRTLLVLALTAVTMAAEIVAGLVFNSMALLADGWHMLTHAGAFGIALFAYWFSRRHADDRHFAFGTGKVGVLGGFTSAILLAGVAVMMVWESLSRLTAPQAIAFDMALLVAVLGLLVNGACALLLSGGVKDGHRHDHHHAHHRDHNLHAAYIHVLADLLTSVLAIVALLLGKYAGWWWMDPAMGVVGAAVILRWSWGLVRSTGAVLLDMSNDDGLTEVVRAAIEGDGDNRLADLHLWQLGTDQWGAIVSVVTHLPREPAHYLGLLAGVHELRHVTIEVHRCDGDGCGLSP